MRDTAYTQALASAREVRARLTISDYRLRFEALPVSEDPAGYDFYDACEYGTGILQAARLKSDGTGLIRFRYASDPAALPAWQTLASGVGTITGLALFGGRLFLTGSSEALRYADFNESAFGAFTVTAIGTASLIAPLSTTDFFAVRYSSQAGQPFCYAAISYHASFGAAETWTGRLYDTAAGKRVDALRVGSSDYFFGTEEAGKRTIYLKKTGASWSEVHAVIPMDVVDDVSRFSLGSVSLINNRAIVTGVLGRSAGASMHIYSFGPERFSLGRDLFITTRNPAGWGKLHLVGANLWYIGPGIYCRADATELVGYTNPSKTTVVENIANLRLSCSSNQAYMLNADLPASISHAAIRPGSKVKAEAVINGEASHLGNFNIDAVARPSDEQSQGLTLVARSQAMKELAGWESDAPYDYWSQTKLSTNPADLSGVIRTAGQWKEENGELTTYELNRDGYLYTSARSSRNASMRVRYRRMSCDSDPRIGVGVNYYIETKAEAALRLGKDQSEIVERDYGHNGLFAVLGKHEHNALEGVGLYLVRDSVWTKLTSAAMSIADGAYHWLQLRFREGHCQVQMRADGLSTWSTVLAYTFERFDACPWKYDYQGRGAVYVRNETPSSTTRTILGNLIAVDDNTLFPASELLLVDSEVIAYSGKSVMPSFADLAAYEGMEVSGHGYITGDVCVRTANDLTRIVDGGLSFGTSGAARLRQKLTASSLPVGCVLLRLYKVGSPTDTVRVTLAKSSLAARASSTIKGTDLPEWAGEYYVGQGEGQGLHNVFAVTAPFTRTTIAAGDYLILERSGEPDDENYYRVGLCTLGGTAVAGQVYNGSAWVNAAGTIPTVLYSFFSASTYLNPYLNSPWGPDFINCVMKLIPLVGKNDTQLNDYRGLKLDDQWVAVKAYNAATSLFTFTNPVPAQSERPYRIYPSLMITARGMNGTKELTHSDNTPICIYRPGPFIYLSRVEFFSSERDLSLEDMIAEVAAKVGQYQVSGALIYPSSVVPSAVNPAIRRRNVIARLDCSTLNGTVVLECDKPDASSPGHALAISPTGITFNGERYPIINPGKLVVSLYNDIRAALGQTGTTAILYITVWDNGCIHSFTHSDAGTGEYFQISGSSTNPLPVSIAEACMRVDNWILDNGKKGADLINEMIGEKRFFYQEGGSGIRLFRTRTEVNPGVPYRLAMSETGADTDVNLATRIRIEGGELYEVLDEPFLVEHGNLFKLVHMSEVETLADAQFYGEIVMEELGSRYRSQNFVGAADPRVEPNDILYVQMPDRVVEVLVDNVEMVMSVTEADASFDMSVSGRVPRSEQ